MGPLCNAHQGGLRANWIRILVIIITGLLIQGIAPGRALSAEKHKASTSRAARNAATDALPIEQLTPEWQDAVSTVVKKATIYRRLPSQVVDCDPELYDFLLDHPELLVNIWEAMGISNVALERTGKNTFQASDGDGTKAELVTLHRTAESQLIYAQGTYHGPLFRKPVRARCVMLLRYVAIRETNGRYYVTAVLDTFIKLDHLGVEVLAKTFQPLVGKVADYNFRETMTFVSSLSRAIEKRPQSVERLSKKLDKVTPEVRSEFLDIASKMSNNVASSEPLAEKVPHEKSRTRLVQRNQPVSLTRKQP